MLSYNIQNKFDKVLDRIKYKLDTKGLSKTEIFLKQNEASCLPSENPEIGDQVIEGHKETKSFKSKLLSMGSKIKSISMRGVGATFQFATNQGRHMVEHLGSIYNDAKNSGENTDKALWDGKQAKKVANYIKSFSGQLEDKFVNPSKRIARGMQGVVLNSKLRGFFGGKSNDLELDTANGTLKSRGSNGALQYLKGLGHTVQNYTKRLRGAVSKEDWVNGEVDGELLPADHPKYSDDPIAKRNQQMAIDWRGIVSNGYRHLTNKNWKEFLKKREEGKLKLYDTYDKDGNIDQQVPKSVIESIHNLDGASIISTIKLIKTIGEDTYGDELGKIWSGNEKERLTFLEKIKNDPRVKDKINLYAEDEEGNQIDNPQLDAKLAVFIHALEKREFCRTFNNQMQVVINGRERIYKHARNMYNALLQNKTTLEHQGGESELNDGQKVSRRGLIGEVAKWNVAKQLAKDWMKEDKNSNDELAQGENPSMRLILIARYQGLEIDGTKVKITSSPPSAVEGVETMITNSIQKKLKDSNPQLGEPNFKYTSFVKTISEVFGFEDSFKRIATQTDVDLGIEHPTLDPSKKGIKVKVGETIQGSIKSTKGFLENEEIRSKVMEIVYLNADTEGQAELGVDLDEAIKSMSEEGEFEYQINSVMTYLDDIRKTQNKVRTQQVKNPKEGNKDHPDVAIQKALLKVESQRLYQQMDSDTVQARYFREVKSEKNKLYNALNEDGSYSSQELPQQTKDQSAKAGYLNKSLDEYTMGQVIALENGRPSLKHRDGYQGASLWGFEDHHIYGKGDNQANTHFALVFRPFHQNGLHLANFMIENYDSAVDHIAMLAEYVEHYEANKHLITSSENHLTEEQIYLIKLYASNPNELKKLYRKNKKGELRLREGATIPTITTIPIDIGDNSTAIENRIRLGLMTPDGENKVMSGYFYPPITEKVTGSIKKGMPDGYYEDTIRTRGGQYLALWENDTILETNRAFELDWIGEDEV